MRLFLYLTGLLLSLSVTACRHRVPADCSAGTAVPAPAPAVIQRADSLFSMPHAPAFLHNDSARTVFLLENYWSGLDWSGFTATPQDSAALERIFAVWANLVCNVPAAGADCSALMITSGHGYPWLQSALYSLSDRMFNDPNSPYRSEQLFLPILEAYVADSLIPEQDKVRPAYLLQQLGKNRPGSTAANLFLQGVGGGLTSLNSLFGHWQYILLYFFNPDCHDCERVGRILRQDSTVTTLQAAGKLKIVAIYPDHDLEAWNSHLGDSYPPAWTVGRITSDLDRERYYLPAIPNLYLLDTYGRVLLKDSSLELVIQFLGAG